MSASHASKRRGIAKLVGVALAAFAFTFALVPLYRIACEKVFGVRLEKTAISSFDRLGMSGAGGAKSERTITVMFDGGVNSKLPWAFHPQHVSMRVHPGEQYATTYYARNNSTRAIVGNAAPSLAPARASGYFGKTECFCFTAQTLQAGEARDMPVHFIVDPALPVEINTITLSYTFFKNDVLTARLEAPSTNPQALLNAPRAAP